MTTSDHIASMPWVALDCSAGAWPKSTQTLGSPSKFTRGAEAHALPYLAYGFWSSACLPILHCPRPHSQFQHGPYARIVSANAI